MKFLRLMPSIAAACCLSACDPFASTATNEEVVIPQSQVASFELLIPSRKLPPSARNVRVFVRHFQDTSLWVRFDANAVEAREFAEKILGAPLTRDTSVLDLERGPKVDWWISEDRLAQAERGEDMIADGNDSPPVAIALLYNGDTATVWLHTFTT